MSRGIQLQENAAGADAAARSAELDCFMAYEDLQTGLRAKRVLGRVLANRGDPLPSHLELLRFDLLTLPELHFWAARQAAHADIIVLSSHGDLELPGEVKAWLGLCTCRGDDRAVALVASLDASLKSDPEGSPALAHLRGVAARKGLSLFTHFGGTSVAPIRLAIQRVSCRLRHSLHADDGRQMTPDTRWSGWGINE